jgi:lipocalin-like protein
MKSYICTLKEIKLLNNKKSKMKNVLSYFLATMLVVGLFACKGNKSDMLVAKWKISSVNDGREVPADQKEAVDKMMAEMLKDSYFEFKKDGSFEMSVAGKTQKGTWKLSDDAGKLIMTEEGEKDKPDSMIVADLSDSKVTLSEEKGTEKVKFTLSK